MGAIRYRMNTYKKLTQSANKIILASLIQYTIVSYRSVKLLLYNTLFVSPLNYCHLVWGTTTKTNFHRIFLLQKRASRLVCDVPHLFHTDQIFEKIGVLIKYINNTNTGLA